MLSSLHFSQKRENVAARSLSRSCREKTEGDPRQTQEKNFFPRAYAQIQVHSGMSPSAGTCTKSVDLRYGPETPG